MTDTPPHPKTHWWFYHVKGDDVERAIYNITKLCWGKKWRVLIVSPDEKRRESLDRLLWTAEPTSFIPHGRAEAEGLDPAVQPILISAKADNLNAADILLLLDGAVVDLDVSFIRCITLFGDDDAANKDMARSRYKSAKDADLVVKYFQQDPSGKWVERA